MRSSADPGEQGCLPFDLPTDAPRDAPTDLPTASRTGTPAGGLLRHWLATDALASRGWPAGTELLVDPARRPRRGEVALARHGDREVVGVFGLELGRTALRHDRGSVWLTSAAQVVGVVVMAGPPLAGLPATLVPTLRPAPPPTRGPGATR
ncbi:hypothetical protein [Nocardioides sp. YIM 152588]|uniref:hypothetical protein n=1 Tax=Nocardioides sp. YIM 152588 TaxID=3158259 RepID=UPI0032E45129